MDWIFTFACAAYNLVRLRNLPAQFRRCKFRPKCVLRSTEAKGQGHKTSIILRL